MEETDETLPHVDGDDHGENVDSDDNMLGLVATEKTNESTIRAGMTDDTAKLIKKRTRSARTVGIPERYAHVAFFTAEAFCGDTVRKDEVVPETAQSAAKDVDGHNWTRSMLGEPQSLAMNYVFTVLAKSQERKLMPFRWVFALKRDARGKVAR